jgi:DNA invertase Pin-like site-specific DNA recombinase/chaperonin cofactor prefoldin
MLAYDNQYNQMFYAAPFGGFKMGGYVRLSREDKEKFGGNASESISNQKELISQYAKQHNLEIVDFYEDDDETGQDYQRAGFERLLADMEAGRVNMVITKDLSRLGRDMGETSDYVYKYFPLKRIRYISILENFDTFSGRNDSTQIYFKLMMNDMYSKDISDKILATFRAKRQAGVYIGGFPPYGYKMEVKGSFVIDEPAAAIVRRIFAAYVDGQNYVTISNALNAENILPPVLYKQQTSNFGGCRKSITGKWNSQAIRRILLDKTYIGCMVQNKYRKINYKVQKYEIIKKENWIVVPDMHDPIVTKEVFEMAQSLVGRNNTKYTKNPQNEGVQYQHVLSGLLFCGECGKRMTFDRNKNSSSFNVLCSGYKKKTCTSARYFITEKELEEFVLAELKSLFKSRINKRELMESAKGGKIKVELDGLTKQEAAINKELDVTQNTLRSLYRDKFAGKITERDYEFLYEDFNKNRDTLEKNLDTLQQQKNRLMKYQEDSKEILAAVDDFIANEILSKTTIHKLINRIETFANRSIQLYANFSCA